MLAFPEDPRGPSLYIRGVLSTRPGDVPLATAQLVGCPNCQANCDASSVEPRLNIDDFVCFVRRYAAHEPYANCNMDEHINIDDFVCFINRFAQGCP